MVLINGVKFACERCIRGHRVSSCNHTNGDLIMIKKKGRPSLQCPHCREQRKVKNSHSACVCGKKGKTAGQHLTSCGCHKTSSCICGSKSTTEKLKRLLSPFLPRLNSLALSDAVSAKSAADSSPSPTKCGSTVPPLPSSSSPMLAYSHGNGYSAQTGDSIWDATNADMGFLLHLLVDDKLRNADMDMLLRQFQNQTQDVKTENSPHQEQALLMDDAEFLEFFGVDNALLNGFPRLESVSPVQPPPAPAPAPPAKVPAPSFPFYETHDSAPIPHRELIRPYRLRHGYGGDGHRAGANGLLKGGHAHPISPVQQRSDRRLVSRSSSISATSAHVEPGRLPRPPSVISIGSVSSSRSYDHTSLSQFNNSQQNLPNITNSSAFPPTDYFSSGDLSSQDGDQKTFPLFSGPTLLDMPSHTSSMTSDSALSSKWGPRDGAEPLIDEEHSSDHNDQTLIALHSRRGPLNKQLLRSASQMLYQQRQRVPGVASPHRESDLYKMFPDESDNNRALSDTGNDAAKPLIDSDFGQGQLLVDDDSLAGLCAEPSLDFFDLPNVFDTSAHNFAAH